MKNYQTRKQSLEKLADEAVKKIQKAQIYYLRLLKFQTKGKVRKKKKVSKMSRIDGRNSK